MRNHIKYALNIIKTELACKTSNISSTGNLLIKDSILESIETCTEEYTDQTLLNNEKIEKCYLKLVCLECSRLRKHEKK